MREDVNHYFILSKGEVSRQYILHVPANYDPSNTVSVPLVLGYHGWGGSAWDNMNNFYWSQVADKDDTGRQEYVGI